MKATRVIPKYEGAATWDGCSRQAEGPDTTGRAPWIRATYQGSRTIDTKTGQRKYPLACEFMVGVRRFELLTSSVSGKRSPPELNARISAAGVAARSILRENARVTQPSIESFSRITITSQREGPRASGAGVPRTHACAEESPAPARKRRREGTLVRDCCGNAPSGEKLTPQQRLSTGFRTRRALRRGIDAAAEAFDGNPYEKGPPAPE